MAFGVYRRNKKLWHILNVANLNTEVPSVDVVSQEKVFGGGGGSAHLEQLHQVVELTVDVPAHLKQR